MKKTDDDNVGEWVLATWSVNHSATLNFVLRKEGRPALHYHPTTYVYEAYRWNSYHAAAKFKRENKSVRGYVIVNLRDIKQQSELQDKYDDEQTQEEREELRNRFERGREP